MTVNADATSGQTDGISAIHNGSGEFDVHAANTTTGGTGSGIFAQPIPENAG